MEVSHQEHRLSVGVMQMFFGCAATDLPHGLGWANDGVSMISHAGTHVDAPWHYSPVCEGRRARTIDEMPLEWFYGDGVVLDMRHKPRGSAISVGDLQAALARIKRQVNPAHYEIYHLHVVLGEPVSELKRALGVNVGQIYQAKHRVGALVRKQFKKLNRDSSGGGLL